MLKTLVAASVRASALGLFLAFLPTVTRAQTDHFIYTDSLQNSWENWSWSTTLDFNQATTVHGGTRAISATITGGWGAVSLHHADFDSSPYSDLTFWVHGGATGGQLLKVYAELSGVAQASVNLPPLTANAWQQITLSLGSLGVANKPNFSRFSIQDRNGSAWPAFYIDDIKLVANSVPPPAIALTSPAEGGIYISPAAVPLAATVTTNGHTINKVQFYAGGTLLAEDTTPPYSGSWSGAAGSYAVFARVVYDGTITRDSAAANIVVATPTPVTIAVNAQLNRRAISPLIYGTAFASTADLSDLNFTINRSGGNAETRYNWQLNAHNRAADWYFQSIGDNPATPGAASDSFITGTKSAGATPAITIPMIEWMPKLGASRGKLASYSTNKYGPQTDADYSWMPQAGNGVGTNAILGGTWMITTNDPTDANFLTNSNFQLAFLQRLTNRFGAATNGGVRHYILDNEHTLWHSTHRDVHPNGASRQEIRDKMIDYATKIKSIDPDAQVWGPEEFGWSGYFNSGADLQYGDRYGWGYLPDRATNGGTDYVVWLLDQMRQHEVNTGRRLLDYFTLHRYTEEHTTVGGNDVSTAIQLKRSRSTRSFWDPGYVDESWINQPVKLIPRMKAWVASYYPGTKIGITEYNWGAESHINGATTQADLLGIFGREGLDLATRWTTPSASSPTYKAMKMYRNYDGNKSTFGDTSVSATGPNPDNVSVFAAVRSTDGALTLMVINKQLGSVALPTINLTNFQAAGTAQLWQLTSANVITRLSDLTFSGTTITNSLPAQSITIYVVPAAVVAGPASAPNPAQGATGVPVTTLLSWTPGTNAASHRVFFGTSSNAVWAATTNATEFLGTFLAPTCNPPVLATSGRYFWRVDEALGADLATGPVWTFATVVDPAAGMMAVGAFSSGTNFAISFPSRSGQAYRVERTDHLFPASWTAVADRVPGTGSPLQIIDVNATVAERYYRVVILPP